MKSITKISIAALGIIILFSLYQVIIHKKSEFPETTLEKSFNLSNAKIVTSEVYFWAKLENNYNEDRLTQFASSLLKELKVVRDETFSETVTESDSIIKKETGGLTGDNKIIRLLYEIQKKQDSKNESYISLKITKDLSNEGITEIKNRISGIFRTNGIEPRSSMCITGSYDGKLSNDRMNALCARVFKGVDARKVEGIRDEKLISVSAYSPSLEQYIKVNNKKVNLNLAIRYNSYEDKTYIWLATPVIAIEY